MQVRECINDISLVEIHSRSATELRLHVPEITYLLEELTTL